MIIDAHAHLWNTQNGRADGEPVLALQNGLSSFAGELRQMMPPYMTDGANTAERLIANMDYAGVAAAVITQEEIDGNQDDYLLQAKRLFPARLKICSLYEEQHPYALDGFDGVKICAGRLREQDLTKHISVFQNAEKQHKFVSIDLADGSRQTGMLNEIVQELPSLKIAIGHFGMVTRAGWEEQIKLARRPNVRIESGGITWLFHSEGYPFPSAVRAIQAAAALCGYEKLMWGSDYPRTMVAITYQMSFDFLLKSNEISPADRERFLWQNAASFYGFDSLNEPPKIKNMLED